MTMSPPESPKDRRVLSVEEVANIRERIDDGESVVREFEWIALCDSHEALRSSLAALREENDRLRAERDEYRREWKSACERERARWDAEQAAVVSPPASPEEHDK